MMTSYERQQARIAARKARNEQYYNRLVKNPKARALGVDKAFLDKQVEYKKAVASAEKQADLEYAEQTAAIVDILEERKYKMDEEKAEENASYKAAWDVQVAEKPNRREYELNDPKILSKTRPPRVGDDDPNCGPASLQRFAGEDLSRDSRVKSQKQQLRSWIKDAVSVKEQQRTEAAQEEKEYADFVDEVEAIRLEAEVDAQREARLASVETFSVNQHLAAARAQAATELDLEQKALGEAEVEREINSKWLNEDPSQAVSAVNPKRYRTDHFKGFAPEVVGKIIKTVDSQLQDKADAQRAELEEKELEANFGDQIRDIMAEQNFQTKMDRATENAKYREDIMRQIEEKKAREAEEKAYYKKVAIQEGGLLSGFGKSYR